MTRCRICSFCKLNGCRACCKCGQRIPGDPASEPFGSPRQKQRLADGRMSRERIADVLYRWSGGP